MLPEAIEEDLCHRLPNRTIHNTLDICAHAESKCYVDSYVEARSAVPIMPAHYYIPNPRTLAISIDQMMA